TEDAKQSKDTDWFLDRLYDFAADFGIHILKPKWSRYYIDLNRDPDGKDLYPGADNTELCTTTGFDSSAIYLTGMQPTKQQICERVNRAWKPYHHCIKDTLAEIVSEHGYAILFEAHSIASHVPRFFEGQLTDFNFGTSAGKSCDSSLLAAIENLDFQSWSRVSNGRFKGGYITRQYGEPENNVHAIQLELSQATYMDESTMSWNAAKAEKVKIQLQMIIKVLLDWSQ
ncbi:MAG: N-formylglutamate deformylase, partial [Gammaproteobacteria bacterium]|nr:N-formylglutamate deformylase [Gammaproteobacteria bacterium]